MTVLNGAHINNYPCKMLNSGDRSIYNHFIHYYRTIYRYIALLRKMCVRY